MRVNFVLSDLMGAWYYNDRYNRLKESKDFSAPFSLAGNLFQNLEYNPLPTFEKSSLLR